MRSFVLLEVGADDCNPNVLVSYIDVDVIFFKKFIFFIIIIIWQLKKMSGDNLVNEEFMGNFRILLNLESIA